MKRELIQNVKVAPFTSGAAIDRKGFLSLIFAAAVATAGKLTVAVAHSDTVDGTFEPVKDTRLAPDEGTLKDGVVELDVAVGDVVNIDLDLVGCKQFVKVSVTGAAAADTTYAYALGDTQYAPV